ncbi:MAG: hypothetical protein D6712_16715 [Chloroflexi bacterium]|nr:MAG: hypothetical protein D6712_16715 [Chloroflexota bacterium]
MLHLLLGEKTLLHLAFTVPVLVIGVDEYVSRAGDTRYAVLLLPAGSRDVARLSFSAQVASALSQHQGKHLKDLGFTCDMRVYNRNAYLYLSALVQ